jgi:hypothetical protein
MPGIWMNRDGVEVGWRDVYIHKHLPYCTEYGYNKTRFLATMRNIPQSAMSQLNRKTQYLQERLNIMGINIPTGYPPNILILHYIVPTCQGTEVLCMGYSVSRSDE